MRKEIYYSQQDALARATEFADENNGIIDKRPAMVDSHMHFDIEDDRLQEIGWTGECAAFRVKDKDTYNEIALIGYFD